MSDTLSYFCQSFIIDLWFYWLLVFIGFVFKIHSFARTHYTFKQKVCCIAFDILIIILWTDIFGNQSLFCNELYEKWETIGIITLLIYCFYTINKKCNNGYTESLLIGINSLFVTALSFMSPQMTIPIALLIICISKIIIKIKDDEKISEFCEIVILSVESIIISIVSAIFSLKSQSHVLLITIFTETFLVMFNEVVINCVRDYYGEKLLDV